WDASPARAYPMRSVGCLPGEGLSHAKRGMPPGEGLSHAKRGMPPGEGLSHAKRGMPPGEGAAHCSSLSVRKIRMIITTAMMAVSRSESGME
ncbi:MAG: hypothetical protein LUG99_17145, partial [Lachnospiraceae bacterium]|nr:hypothetical protein [Lachnospiraceae bacterium]